MHLERIRKRNRRENVQQFANNDPTVDQFVWVSRTQLLDPLQ